MKSSNPMIVIALSVLLAGCVTEEDVTEEDLVEEGAVPDDTIVAAAIGTLQPETSCTIAGFQKVTSSPGYVRCPPGTICTASCATYPAWRAATSITMRYKQSGSCTVYLASGGRGAWSANTIASTAWRERTSTVPTTSRPLSTSVEILVPSQSTCDFSLDWMKFN